MRTLCLLLLSGSLAFGQAFTFGDVAFLAGLSGQTSALLENLLGYWKLDESAFLTRQDSSVNNRDLTLYAPWFPDDTPYVAQVPGKIGNAIELTEWGAGVLVNQTMPDLATSDVSAALWVFPVTGEYGGQFMFCLGDGLYFVMDFWNDVEGGLSPESIVVGGTATDDNGANTYSFSVQTPNGTLVLDQWAHFAFVKSGNTIKIYINGVEQAMGAFTGTIFSTATEYYGSTDLMVGTSVWGYPALSPLDELGLWQRALSAEEVEQLYNLGDGLPFENF